jgi:lysophosphatidate acyltransferase
MTAADVHDLSARVREVMLEALYEISPKVASKSEKVVTEKVFTDKVTKEQEQSSTPLELVSSLVPTSIGVIPSSVEEALSSVGSTSSLASSSDSVGQRSGREDGAETEEDEEMVLVGRPKK